MLTSHQVCTRCVMDTTDPDIRFDENGICNRCRDWEKNIAQFQASLGNRETALQQLIEEIKTKGHGQAYDCVIGVSGGVDSTYVAYLVKQLGLRPLAVHLDNGWDSELAVSNIEKCLKNLGIDLFTYVLDWDEFRDLQLAFLKASTPDSEIPTDHAITALLLREANKHGIKHILMGSNLATEGIVAPAWSRGHQDWKYINSVHQQFGSTKLKTYPKVSIWEYLYFRFIRGIRLVPLLNYVDYNKNAVIEILKDSLGYTPYGGKHHESLYTRFYQTYVLPCKFGYDKRKWHLSDLIMSKQITREQALEELEQPPLPQDVLRQDKAYVAKKLGLNEAQFDEIMALPPKSILDYPSYEQSRSLRHLKKAWGTFRRLTMGIQSPRREPQT
jgi:N-acetyl sugar amidotransferase